MTLDITKALHYARLAEAAYWADGDTEEFMNGLGYKDVEQYSIDHSQSVVAARDDEVVAVIRGSDDLVDWIRNLKAVVKTPLRDWDKTSGRVHRGFHQAYQAIAHTVALHFRALRQDRPNAKTVLVGHSLGAAVAALMAVDAFNGFVDEVWLYGCPRVGNRRFAKEYNFTLGNKTTSIRNNCDAVPLLPFWNKRIGRQWYLPNDDWPVYDPGLLRRAVHQAAGIGRWYWHKVTGANGLPEFVTDHFMRSYVERLEDLET